jgi:outer membrane protein OmpA-like peptidoglycan-associated protein
VFFWKQKRGAIGKVGESNNEDGEMKRYFTAASLLLSAGLSASVFADETRTEGFNLELTPYIWAAGIDGKLSVGNDEVNFNRSFSDIIDNTDAAFMGLAVISYDRFVLYADYDYLSLSNDAKTKRGIIAPVGTKVQADTDLGVGTYAAGYRFNTFGKNTIDVLIGAQLTDIQEKFQVNGGTRLDNKDNATDTVVMLRPSFQISERWRFNPTLAYGVSGDSDTTYTMMPQFQYQFADSFAARFGYKRLYYKFKDNNNNEFEPSFEGPFLGVGWTFPARAEKVVAAPPPPAPVAKPKPVVAAAPAKCPDADHDGVCDAVDQCPSTPAGARVGPGGCDCDYVLALEFPFNSAELHADDKAKIDAIIPVLKNPKVAFVAGEVDGYTDNTGEEAYNVGLSKRRAQAVVDYVKSQGVNLGDRFVVNGYGEAYPVASNDTKEGRAQNRRVVLRRTDCGPAH